MRPHSSAATILQKPCLVTAAKLHWMKRSGTTWPLRSIRGITHNTKRIAHSSWTGLQNKIGKRIKPFTISKIPTQPWLCTTKLTEQRWLCHRSPSSLTTTSPARSRRMANCCSLARAPLPLATPPFASCKPHNIYILVCNTYHTRWTLNSRRSTAAPRGTGKGWPPSNNWLPLPRSLKMLQNNGLPNKRCGKFTSPTPATSLDPSSMCLHPIPCTKLTFSSCPMTNSREERRFTSTP